MKYLSLFFMAVFVCMAAHTESPAFRVGILTDGTSDFWTALHEAALEESREQGIVLDFQTPDPATMEQQQILAQKMLENGVQALAFCPIKPKEQQAFLKEISQKTALVTLYTDAPGTGRRVFLTRDNFEVGKQLGALIKTAIPEGLKIMAFCGEPADTSTQARVKGLQETLDDTFYLEGPKADFGDRMLAAANTGEVLRKRPEIACVIGLEAYHAPMMARTVTQAGRARMVRVVAFGNTTTQILQQITEGVVHGLVVDDAKGTAPIVLGVLKSLAEADKEFTVPEEGCIRTPVTTIKTENALGAQEMLDALNTQVPWISETTPGRP